MNLRLEIIPWLKAARLNFCILTFLAYSAGAFAAKHFFEKFDLTVFIAGYAVVFIIQLLTILINDYVDYEGDKVNNNASPYSGGSQVLVKGNLQLKDFRKSFIWVSLLLVLSSTSLLIFVNRISVSPLYTGLIIVTGSFLSLGYSAPPFKFNYRGYGEFVAAFIGGSAVMLCGWFFQTGTFNSAVPWVLSIPFFFAVLAMLLITQIPDFKADLSISKLTFAVRKGPRSSAYAAILTVLIAAALAYILLNSAHIPGPWRWSFLFLAIHSSVLILLLIKLIRQDHFDKRMDGTLNLSLTFTLWFCIIPIVYYILN